LIAAAAPEQSVLGGLTHVYYIGEVFDALIDAEELTLVEELLGSATHDELPVTIAALRRARGKLQARHGELAEAETELAQAATILRDAGNPFELARTLLDDGRVLIELGRTGEATAVLQKAAQYSQGSARRHGLSAPSFCSIPSRSRPNDRLTARSASTSRLRRSRRLRPRSLGLHRSRTELDRPTATRPALPSRFA
jgi:hypothetical protein